MTTLSTGQWRCSLIIICVYALLSFVHLQDAHADLSEVPAETSYAGELSFKNSLDQLKIFSPQLIDALSREVKKTQDPLERWVFMLLQDLMTHLSQDQLSKVGMDSIQSKVTLYGLGLWPVVSWTEPKALR